MAALSEIEKLEARWAENPDGRYFAPLADAYRKAGRVDDAIQVVTQGLVKHPDYLSAHIVLGRCFLERKDDVGAGGAFEKVLSLDGENIIALKSLAEISERAGAVTDARRWLQRLLTIDAMNAEAAEDLVRLGGPLDDGAPAAAEAEPAEAEDIARISFADIAPEPAAPEPMAPEPVALEPEPAVERKSETTRAVPAVAYIPPEVPKTLEHPVVTPDLIRLANEPTLGLMPAVPPPDAAASAPTERAPALDVESTSFTPPPPGEAPSAPSPDFVPFDDQLQWGAGERQSQAIHAEDIVEAESHHEATASAIDFLGGAPAMKGTPQDDVGGEPEAEPMMLEPALPAGQQAAPSTWDSAPEIPELDLAVESGVSSPPPEAVAASAATRSDDDRPSGELRLIMPEDVTPAEEFRRPSSKQVQMVSPEPAETAVSAGAELMVTETMGDLYLRQGFKDQAAEVYRRLLSARPGEPGLQAKLAAIESPPAFSASALGAEAVGAWLRRIAKAQLPTPAATPPPAAPEVGPTPMEQAFAASEPEPVPVPSAALEPAAVAAEPAAEGSPARPATDPYSLDRIFGGPGGTPAPAPAAPPPAAAHTLGASFDEFFGSAPKQETARPKESGGGERPSEDDLSAFNAWLHGLKR